MATLVASALLLSPLGNQRVTGLAAIAATLFVANAYFTVESGGCFQPDSETSPFLSRSGTPPATCARFPQDGVSRQRGARSAPV